MRRTDAVTLLPQAVAYALSLRALREPGRPALVLGKGYVKRATETPREKLSLKRALIITGIHILAVWTVVYDFDLVGLGLSVVAFVLTYGFGISLGYHKLIAHQAFHCSRTLRLALGVLGALCYQGGPLRWALMHRAHHRDSDHEGDPHSRHRGFLFSHFGWLLVDCPNGFSAAENYRLIRDLHKCSELRWLERAADSLNFVLFPIVACCWGMTVALWLFPVRLVVAWHTVWIVNSLCHYRDGDEYRPRNIKWLGWLTFGESFHANHHDRPSRAILARTSDEWPWDPGAWVLTFLQKAGIVQLREERSGGRSCSAE